MQIKHWLSFIIAVASLALLPLVLFANESSLNTSAKTSSKSNIDSLFTPEEHKWLEKKQALTYVYDPDWAPFEWKNDIDMHTGIIADILSLISKNAGIELIAINTDTWEKSVDLVNSGKADMFSAITQNSAREEHLNFTSRDIYSYPAVFITQFDDKAVYLDIDKDFKGKRIGVVKGSGLGQFIKEKYPGLEYVDIPATQTGFSSLRKKKIDIFAINTVTARYFIEKKGFSDLKIALKFDYIYHLKIAIRKDMPGEIISILDKSLGNITEEELNDIFNKWTETAIRQRTDWKLILQITSALLVIILFLIWSNRRLNLKVIDRTKELNNINIELKNALEQTQQANNAKSLFLANVSHEIRTPMNGVLSMIQVLRGTSLDEEQKHYIDTLDSSGKNLMLLIDDLLDLSKIESGKLELNIEPFEVFSWITDIQNITEPFFENQNSIFITQLDKDLPAYLEGDAARLLQITVNLISNAAKSTQQGEVKLIVDGHRVSENNFKLHISIEDTGQGIPDEKLDLIFEAFHQLEPDRVSNKGVGLGLAICKRLSDIMNGQLQVTSELGKGSCFTFDVTLPVPEDSSHFANIDDKTEIIHKLSILLVDDEPVNRFAARTLLEQDGHEVIEAENGQIAIEKINTQAFDVILMDIHMPVMDGVVATRKIRENNENKLPIIGLTASVMTDEKEQYIKAGMNAVVEKPIVIKKLIKTIQELL